VADFAHFFSLISALFSDEIVQQGFPNLNSY
jgi:hypothetical protein